MGKLERITVTMPEEMAAKMRAAVDSGEYATTSEIVRDAMRDWNDLQERRRAALEQLVAMVDDARKGPFVDGETAMADLRARIAAKVASHDGI